jgi:general secretion pathway protein M
MKARDLIEMFSLIKGAAPSLLNRSTVIFAGSILLLSILVVFLAVAVTSSEKEVSAERARLRELSVLTGEYRSLKGRIDSLEAKESLTKVSGIAQAIDDTVASIGLKAKLKSVKEQGQREVKDEKEETAEIYLERITMNELVNLFYRIEEAPFLFSVKGVTIKKSFENPELLNVTAVIALYRKK